MIKHTLMASSTLKQLHQQKDRAKRRAEDRALLRDLNRSSLASPRPSAPAITPIEQANAALVDKKRRGLSGISAPTTSTAPAISHDSHCNSTSTSTSTNPNVSSGATACNTVDTVDTVNSLDDSEASVSPTPSPESESESSRLRSYYHVSDLLVS